MKKLKTRVIRLGMVISFCGILFSGYANAVDQASLKKARNPFQQTLLRYKAKLNAGTISGSDAQGLNIKPYIVGGVDAKPTAYPWMVALLVAEIPNAYDGQFCGGTLVLPDVVVTAAHCLEVLPSADVVDVAVGAYNLFDVTADQRIKVRGYIMHPNYDDSSLDNDIGIIKLEHPVDTPTLPLIDAQQMAQLMPGEMLTVIGFGALNDPPMDYPNILQEVQLAYVDHSLCNDVMSVVGGITDSQICAGNVGQIQDSCFGDSGGPLMAQINGEWRLTGIVSWGLGCGLPDFYGVYTEAADFVQWVNDAASALYIPGRSYFGYLSLGRKHILERSVDNWTNNDVTISDVTIEDRGLGFSILDNSCENQTLAPNQTCRITLEFEPSIAGRFRTKLIVTGGNGESAQSILAGAALDEVRASRALDSHELDWYSGPELSWQRVRMEDAVNRSAMQAGAIGDSQNTLLLTYVDGPGTISFNWKVSSELDYDYLYLVVDGYIVDAISGDSGWLKNSFSIAGSGEHSVMWAYDKDEYVSELLDTAWLDNVAWTAAKGNHDNERKIASANSGNNSGGAGASAWLLLLTLLFTLRSRISRH